MTGVQTCALPISGIKGWTPDFYPWSFTIDTDGDGITDDLEIGRASCRERV